MKVQACPRCASLDVRPSTVADGMAAGGSETLLMVCHACHFRGSPLFLDDGDAYVQLRAAVAGRTDDAGETDEPADPRLVRLLRTRAPGPPRLSAVLVMAFGVANTLLAAGIAFLQLQQASQGVVDAIALLSLLVAASLGVAFLRIGARMWRPTSAPIH